MFRRRFLSSVLLDSRPSRYAQPARKRSRHHAEQGRDVPERIAAQMGGGRRPIAFLPRQPVEADGSVFDEGVDALYDHRSASSTKFERDEELLESLVDQHYAKSASSELDPHVRNSEALSLQTRQIPLAVLESPRLGLPLPLLRRLRTHFNITHLTPVQAKMLQRAYLLHDCAVCAETGSGKTFGLCIALIAKLLRNGPNQPRSSMFLVPSDVLVKQVARWLNELWPFGKDHDSHYSHFARRFTLVAELTTEHYGDAGEPHRVFSELREKEPLIIVSTPETMWPFLQYSRLRIEEALQEKEDVKMRIVDRERSGGGKNALTGFSLMGYRKKNDVGKQLAVKPVFASLDNLVVDEADVVLPCHDPAAPGNLLVAELTNPVRFRSPLQLILNSATLSPASVSHIRRFLKKHVFAGATAQIFNSDDINGGSSSAEKKPSGLVAGPAPSAAPSILQLSENVRHQFFAADSIDELGGVLTEVFSGFANKVEEQYHQQQRDAEAAAEKKRQQQQQEQERRASDAHFSSSAPKLSLKQRAAAARKKLDAMNSPKKVVAESTTSAATAGAEATTTTKTAEPLPKIIVVYPVELNYDNGGGDDWSIEAAAPAAPAEQKQAENDDQDDDAETAFVPDEVVCAGRVPSIEALEDVINSCLPKKDQQHPQFSFKIRHVGFEQQRHQHDINDDDEEQQPQNVIEILLVDTDQVRGFDDSAAKLVLVLAKPESARELVHWSGRVGRMGRYGDAVYAMSRTWVRPVSDVSERLGIAFGLSRRVEF